jgi:DivIVA domain-containing protein
MTADPTSIDRIRNATFAGARRGYNKQDVDSFLANLADWLASGEGQEQSVVVKEALQDVGRRTGAILTTAEEAAQETRATAEKARQEADAYAEQARQSADAQAKATKESSEAEAERTRSVAARDAEEMITKAKAEVRKIVEEGDTKKADLNSEIDELGERRDSILRRVDELASQLAGAANQHRPAAAPAEEATPAAVKEPNGDGSNGQAKTGAKAGSKNSKSS